MEENDCWPGVDTCGGLFGCGSSSHRRYMIEPEAVDAALTPRSRDRIDHLDELNQEALEPYLASYRVSRRRLVSAGGFLSLLATLVPASFLTACAGGRSQAVTAAPRGRAHVVDSTPPGRISLRSTPAIPCTTRTLGPTSSTGCSQASRSGTWPGGASKIPAKDPTPSSGLLASEGPGRATC